MSIRYIDANELINKVTINTQNTINRMDCVFIDGIKPNNQHFNLEEHDKQIRKEESKKRLRRMWNRNTVPKCEPKNFSDEVLVTVEHMGYKGKLFSRVVKAVYVPYHHCTLEDVCWNMYDGVPNDWEYMEEDDTWWVPEGWYETADYFDEYEYSAITDKVVAWMKLPKPYENNIKTFIEVKNEEVKK